MIGRVRRMGIGIGIGIDGVGAWSIPRNLPDAYWIDPVGAPGTLTYAAQPTVYTSAASYSPSSAILTLSDSADVPAGLSGTSIQGACSDATDVYALKGAYYVSGNRYTLATWLKGDGACNLKVTDNTVVPNFGSSSSSSEWVLAAGEGTAGSPTILMLRTGAAGASNFYFRPVSATNLSLASVAPRQGTGDLVNATAASQPWVDSEGWVRFDKVSGDGFLLASKVDELHAATGAVSCFFAAYPSASAATVGIILGNVNTVSEYGIDVAYDRVYQKVALYISNNTGAYQVISSANGSVPSNAKYIIEYHRDGTAVSLVCNGVEIATGTGTKFGVTTAVRVPCWGNTTPGHPGNGFDGALAGMVINVSTTALSAADKLSARQSLAAQHGITLP